MILRDVLKNIPLFQNLSDEDLALVADRLRKEEYPKGTVLFQEGDPGETMDIIASGQLVVIGRDGEERIATLGPGNFVGDISVLLGQPRTAAVHVSIDAQLWVLHKKDFDDLIATRPSIALEMMRELSRRLVTTTHRRQQQARRRITALIGLRKGIELSEAIHLQLNAPVGVLRLPRAKLPDPVPKPNGITFLDNQDLDEASLAETLSFQVETYRHVVILLPEHPDPLAFKAVDLADTVVSIGEPPDWITRDVEVRDLWVSGESQEELERTARRLTNRLVGVALSSGGSRGLAHVGVLKVLQRENIPIDMIAGTSAGALFGALFALGFSIERMEQFAGSLRQYNRFTNWDINIPPRSGLIKGRIARDRIIAKEVDYKNFEDTRIPLCIVAADILTGEEVVFESGPLADAIRASLSVPVLADPWAYQGRYFVDGGAVNPLPASVLRDRGADIVIASNVVRPLNESYDGPTDRMPNILQSVFNIFSAMEAEMIKKQIPLIDVLVQHQVSAQYTLDFTQAEDLVRRGEETAEAMLPEIKAALQSPELLV